MKKLFIFLILALLLLGGTGVLAQSGPQNYCQIKSDVKWKGGYYPQGATGADVGKVVPCSNDGGKTVVSECDGSTGTSNNGGKSQGKGPKADNYVGDYGVKWDSSKNGEIDTNDLLVDFQTPDWGVICFIATVDKITNWVFYIMTAIAVLLFVYGGIVYMTAMGEPEKASKGSRIIIYAILGLVIALIAKIVPDIVTTLVR
jgi:hypothetical protein